MKAKNIIVTFIIIIVAAAAYVGYKVYHKIHLPASTQRGEQKSFVHGAGGGQSDHIGKEESEMPQSGNLCGSTSGNGQIISLGNNKFTLKQNDGNSRIVHIADQATIRNSRGSASESDLKTGDRVTLVGGPNLDGSFTADVVLVCNGN